MRRSTAGSQWPRSVLCLLLGLFLVAGMWAGLLLACSGQVARASAAPLTRPTVEVWTDRGDSGTYHHGDSILVFFRVGEDSEVQIFNVNAEGEVRLVFPNEWDRDSFARRGRLYAIPARGTYRFAAGPPFGTEHLVAVAAPDALPPEVIKNLTAQPVGSGAQLAARIEAAMDGLPREQWNLGVATLLICP